MPPESKPSNPAPPHSTRLPFLDALRGWAILLVIAVHTTGAFQPGSEFLHRLAWNGRMGVTLFFVVSAVALVIAFKQHSHESSPIRNFFIRRFFRIAPMFYLGIATSLLVDGFSTRGEAPLGLTMQDVMLTGLFLHGWWPSTINSVVFGGWSIAVEVTFYLCFPIVVLYLRSRAALLLALSGSLILAFVLRILTSDFYFGSIDRSLSYMVRGFFDLWFPNQLPIFLMGMLLALALDKQSPPRQKSEAGALLLLSAIALLSCMYVKPIQGILANNHLFAAAFALLTYSLAAWEFPLLVNRFICYIGKISFSMYIAHGPIIRLFEKRIVPMPDYPIDADMRYLLHFLVLASASAIVASVTYYLIERPGIALGSKIIRSRTA